MGACLGGGGGPPVPERYAQVGLGATKRRPRAALASQGSGGSGAPLSKRPAET